MDSALVQPYQHLVQMLATYSGSLQSSQPPSSARWERASAHLAYEMQRLHALAASSQTAPLQSLATRLTQLARAEDDLRLEHSAATPAKRLADERRLVVFAAWQLLQALEHAAALEPAAVET